jgi:hypothetical protein
MVLITQHAYISTQYMRIQFLFYQHVFEALTLLIRIVSSSRSLGLLSVLFSSVNGYCEQTYLL